MNGISGSESNSIRLARRLAQFLVLVGFLINLGWLLEIPLLTGFTFGLSAAPSSALLFLLSGAAVLLYLTGFRLAANVVMSVILAFSVAMFIHRMTGLPMLVEKFLRPSWGPDGSFSPRLRGLMSIPTSAGFIALSAGMLCATFRRRFATDVLVCAVFASGYIGLLSFLYGLRPYTQGFVMPLNISVLFILSSIMLLTMTENSWLCATITSESTGGIVARRALPLCLIALPAIGWARMESIKTGLVPLEFGAALAVCFAALLCLVVGVATAAALNRFDEQRKQAQATLMQSEKLLTAGRLAATVAHEINNPLAAALNAIFLAKSTASDQERNQFLETAEQELRRVASVARQSLGFYRGHSRREEIQVKTVMAEVGRMFQPKCDLKSIQIEIDAEPDSVIVCDPDELRQILTNLLANAIDASASQSTIRVAADAAENGIVELEVRDQGKGIPAELRDQVFEPFFTTKKDMGTGLGLWVVKELVSRNGGTIYLTDVPDGFGTRFVLRFPAASGREDALAATS